MVNPPDVSLSLSDFAVSPVSVVTADTDFCDYSSQLTYNRGFSVESSLSFLPDFTEHPKPKRRKSKVIAAPVPPPIMDGAGEDEVTFFHDFVAGGVAGSASVVVGHPFDTLKVRMQTAAVGSNSTILGMVKAFGGINSLFRGMAAPLSSAAVVNAVVFSSYGFSSRLYDDYIVKPAENNDNGTTDLITISHDPWQKATACGAFAGLVQCVIICPMEHVKCRIQVQHGRGSSDNVYQGSLDATIRIAREHGWRRLFQGWWSTCAREVPAFALYFASYDNLKDRLNTYYESQYRTQVGGDNLSLPFIPTHTQTLTSSAVCGGLAGCVTWAAVYPVDVIKTVIQTAPLTATHQELSMWRVGVSLVSKYGWQHLFRGLGVTLIRAFPVNGTIFPVYEFTLIKVCEWENSRK